jgi:hypothetical protein
MTVSADQVENGKASFVADDGLTVDLALAHPQHGQGGYDLREAVREVISIGPSSLHRLTIFGSDRRESGHF